MVADRFAWALETLAIQPSDQVLEIGCGHGLMVAPVCDALGVGASSPLTGRRP